MNLDQENIVRDALLAYWTSRADAEAQQIVRGTVDIGGRAGATSGTHLDRIAHLLARVCVAAGAPRNAVHYRVPQADPHWQRNSTDGYTLPGYYRPTKQWDVVVYHLNVPIVAIELKSQSGPSYGNNANNRAEEAIGSAVDLARARESGLIDGDLWVGYVFVIEDDERSTKPAGDRDRGMFAKDAIFSNWSYVDRVRLLCKRLTEDRHYDAAWAVATSRPTCPATAKKIKRCPKIRLGLTGPDLAHTHAFTWREIDPVFSGYAGFVDRLSAHIGKHYGIGDSKFA